MTTQEEINSIVDSIKDINQYKDKVMKTSLEMHKQLKFILNNELFYNIDLMDYDEKISNYETELMTLLKLLFDLRPKCLKDDMSDNLKKLDFEIKTFLDLVKQLKSTQDYIKLAKLKLKN